VATIRLASLLIFDFEYARGLELLDEAAVVAAAIGDDHERLWGLGFQGLAHVAMGEIDLGYAEFRQAHEEARARGLIYAAFNTLYNEMELRAMTFDAREALLIADRFDRDYAQFPPGLQSSLGRMFALLELGQPSEALAHAERVMAMGREAGVTTYGLWARNCAVECLLELGRVNEARALVADRSTLVERQDKTPHAIGPCAWRWQAATWPRVSPTRASPSRRSTGRDPCPVTPSSWSTWRPRSSFAPATSTRPVPW
jgi:tetratricopeptide (TPR) repeat protein